MSRWETVSNKVTELVVNTLRSAMTVIPDGLMGGGSAFSMLAPARRERESKGIKLENFMVLGKRGDYTTLYNRSSMTFEGYAQKVI